MLKYKTESFVMPSFIIILISLSYSIDPSSKFIALNSKYSRTKFAAKMLPNYFNNLDKDSFIEDFSDNIKKNPNTNLVVYSSMQVNYLVNKWLYDFIEKDHLYPDFIFQDIINTLTYTLCDDNTNHFYICFIPSNYKQPSYIGCFKINSEKNLLDIEQLCINPAYIKPTISTFKEQLLAVTNESNISLNPRSLKTLINKRHYMDFSDLL